MLSDIEKFLRDRGTVVPFLELATHFLKMNNLTPLLAEQLLQPVLANAPHVVKTLDGYTYKEEINVLQKMFLAQVYPAKNIHFSKVTHVHLYNVQTGDKTAFQLSAHFSSTVEQIYAHTHDAILVFNGEGNQISILNRLFAETLNKTAPLCISFKNMLKNALFTGEIDQSRFDAYHRSHIESELPGVVFQDFINRFSEFSETHSVSIVDLAQVDARLYPDFTGKAFDKNFLDELSTGPGVYVMRTNANAVFYVGKAANLNRRVNSYFQPKMDLDEKHQAIWDKVFSIDIHLCGSELEALLLEQKLFDDLHPEINIVRKVHPREKLIKQRYPRILFLPDVAERTVLVFFMNPGHKVQVVKVDQDHPNEKELAAIVEHTFFKAHEPQQDYREELITSWLATHDTHVAGIDMRQISTIEETLQLVVLNIQQFTDNESVIFTL